MMPSISEEKVETTIGESSEQVETQIGESDEQVEAKIEEQDEDEESKQGIAHEHILILDESGENYREDTIRNPMGAPNVIDLQWGGEYSWVAYGRSNRDVPEDDSGAINFMARGNV